MNLDIYSVLYLFIAFVIGLVVRSLLPAYFSEKGKNLATREDIGAITNEMENARSTYTKSMEELSHQNKVLLEQIQQENRVGIEQIKPLTAEEILRRENYLNSKLAAYFDALNTVYKKFSAEDMLLTEGGTRYSAKKEHPTETEINMAYGKMSLFCENVTILEQFLRIFAEQSSPADIGILINLMRLDLSYGGALIPAERFPYIFGRERPPIDGNTTRE